jgi:hypothetical protein
MICDDFLNYQQNSVLRRADQSMLTFMESLCISSLSVVRNFFLLFTTGHQRPLFVSFIAATSSDCVYDPENEFPGAAQEITDAFIEYSGRFASQLMSHNSSVSLGLCWGDEWRRQP